MPRPLLFISLFTVGLELQAQELWNLSGLVFKTPISFLFNPANSNERSTAGFCGQNYYGIESINRLELYGTMVTQGAVVSGSIGRNQFEDLSSYTLNLAFKKHLYESWNLGLSVYGKGEKEARFQASMLGFSIGVSQLSDKQNISLIYKQRTSARNSTTHQLQASLSRAIHPHIDLVGSMQTTTVIHKIVLGLRLVQAKQIYSLYVLPRQQKIQLNFNREWQTLGFTASATAHPVLGWSPCFNIYVQM